VAVRAQEDRAAPQRAEAGQLGQLIDHAGAQQQRPGPDLAAVERDLEVAAGAVDGRDPDIADLQR
jgi:hypothetical protein